MHMLTNVDEEWWFCVIVFQHKGRILTIVLICNGFNAFELQKEVITGWFVYE